MPLPPARATARLMLLPLSAEHSAGMFEMWSHSAVCQHSGDAHDWSGNLIRLPAQTATDSDRIIDFFVRRSVAGQGFRWAMIETGTGRFVGAIGFNNLAPAAEVAYHVTLPAWGFGFAQEALGEALRWASEYGIRKVEAWIEPGNERSTALICRAGFAPSGMIDQGAHQYVRALD